MEAGCGVGNTIFPLLKQVKTGNLFIFGFDISETAIKLTKKNEFYDETRSYRNLLLLMFSYILE